ncbi:MAG TPA: hypothetical protein VK911_02750 [Vicinamibacterales bacterium]|nr:hypothetical protein [Vicinamibacterales bacterium]
MSYRVIARQARKDLRMLGPWLAAWTALVVVNALVLLPDVELWLVRSGFRPTGLFALASALQTALAMVLAVRTVRADPPASSTAFWVTRPVSAGRVLAAKLAVILGVLVGLHAAAVGAVLIAHDAPLERLPIEVLLVVLVEWLVLLPVTITASFTRDAPRLVIVGVASGLLLLQLHAAAALALGFGEVPWQASRLVTMAAVAAAGGVLVLGHRYVVRRAPASLLLIALVLAAVAVIGDAWPLGRELPTAGSFQQLQVGLDIAASRWRAYGDPRRNSWRHSLNAPLVVGNRPPGVIVRAIGSSSGLRLSSGDVLTDGDGIAPREWKRAPRLVSVSGLPAAVGEMLGARVVGPPVFDAERQQGLIVAVLDRQAFEREAGRPARLDTTLHLATFRVRTEARLDLRAGSRRPAAGGQVMMIQAGFSGSVPPVAGASGAGRGQPPLFVVRLRRVQAKFTPEAVSMSEVAYALHNAARDEVVLGDARVGQSEPERIWPLYLWARHVDVRFHVADGADATAEEWIAGAALVVIGVHPLGVVSRQFSTDLELPGR